MHSNFGPSGRRLHDGRTRWLALIRPEYVGIDPVDRAIYEPEQVAQCDLRLRETKVPVGAAPLQRQVTDRDRKGTTMRIRTAHFPQVKTLTERIIRVEADAVFALLTSLRA
ncbi:hypothetical protein [Streptomyces vilmorinianum]|uniref:hypothetical protein n=1 Tax=Streptomyces vilmorinianum TaxID=3051092 RepID=UPI0024E07E5F|nr:hypothetical protein [Streptomyces vilmorinianum]